MSKKHSPAKTELDNELSIAEVDYRVGNFHDARRLAHAVAHSTERTATNVKEANSILKKTAIDPWVLAVGLVSVIFSAVVAFISAY